jgi:hypothetical protein
VLREHVHPDTVTPDKRSEAARRSGAQRLVRAEGVAYCAASAMSAVRAARRCRAKHPLASQFAPRCFAPG